MIYTRDEHRGVPTILLAVCTVLVVTLSDEVPQRFSIPLCRGLVCWKQETCQ